MSKKVVAVAGASSGIGAAMARRLAAEGYAVALCARRESLLKELCQSITAGGGQALAVKADMTVWDEARHFVQRTVDNYGRVDVLINNIGAGIRATEFENLEIEEIDRAVAVNLMSVLYGCKAVLPVMKAQQSGHIINVTSILGRRARSNLAVYSAGKHGVDGFSRAFMNEVRKYNIKVSNFAPAAIETEWAQKAGIDLPQDLKFLQPEDVAKVAQLIIEAPADLSIWNIDFIAMQHTIDPM